MNFSDHHASDDDPLAKVLFYSVLIHYALVYLFFGNPFLLLNREEGSGSVSQNFDVQLLNFPKAQGEANTGLLAGALNINDFKPLDSKAILTTRIQGQKQDEQEDVQGQEGPEEPKSIEETRPFARENEDLSSDRMEDLSESIQSEALPVTKKVAVKRTMPPNMTGPEDCMLKLVGMVCPNGHIGCITAYREFCASLPE